MVEKKENKWFSHLSKIRKENPDIKNVRELIKLAKKSYVKVEK